MDRTTDSLNVYQTLQILSISVAILAGNSGQDQTVVLRVSLVESYSRRRINVIGS
jgi:hypothetical protein